MFLFLLFATSSLILSLRYFLFQFLKCLVASCLILLSLSQKSQQHIIVMQIPTELFQVPIMGGLGHKKNKSWPSTLQPA